MLLVLTSSCGAMGSFDYGYSDQWFHHHDYGYSDPWFHHHVIRCVWVVGGALSVWAGASSTEPWSRVVDGGWAIRADGIGIQDPFLN